MQKRRRTPLVATSAPLHPTAPPNSHLHEISGLASWAPAEIAAIATGVRPDGPRDRVEICEAAVEVAKAELSFAGDPQAHRRLRGLVAARR